VLHITQASHFKTGHCHFQTGPLGVETGQYPTPPVLAPFRERFERDMIDRYDTHFMVGTVHKHPKNWIIVGLFYPPKQAIGDLFD
jgi:hypothetical protein